LKKRANKIFNNYLKEVDPEMHQILHSTEIHPELVLLRWLRVLLSREFRQSTLLYIWDYLFSSITAD